MIFKWYGTASVSVQSGDSSVLFDPFVPLRFSHAPTKPADYDGFTDIVITHAHIDHIASLPELFARAPRQIYGTRATVDALTGLGIPRDSLHLIKPGDCLVFGGIRVTAFAGRHVKFDSKTVLRTAFSPRMLRCIGNLPGILRSVLACKEKGETVAYLIEAEGKRIFLLGSLSYIPEQEYPTDVDALILPYQGTSDLLTPARELIGLTKPKHVILDHFDDTFPPISADIDTSDIADFCSETLKLTVPDHLSPMTL